MKPQLVDLAYIRILSKEDSIKKNSVMLNIFGLIFLIGMCFLLYHRYIEQNN